MSRVGKGVKPDKSQLLKLYVRESRSIRETAIILGCSKDMIYRTLQKYGLERRDYRQKRSQLQDYKLPDLKRAIKLKGFNQVAAELGVHNTTLRRYMEKMKLQG